MTKKYLGSSSGLTLVTDAGTAFVSSEFNSGHMVGDIKLAALSDTTAETIGTAVTELVTNGNPFVDVSPADGAADSWTAYGGSTNSVSGGVVTITNNDGDDGVYQTFSAVEGQYYKLTYTIGVTTSACKVLVGTAIGSSNFFSNSGNWTTSGSYTSTFRATATGTAYVSLQLNSTAGSSGDFSGISVTPTTELVENGTFDAGTTGWTANIGSFSVVSGAGRLTNDGSGVRTITSFSAVVGKQYTISYDANIGTGDLCSVRISTASDGGSAGQIAINSSVTGTQSFTFTATATTLYIALLGTTALAEYVEYDNISVRPAVEDRSVNNNGLQVHGQLTKTAVATGADLVAWSGFSRNGNYVPVNALQFNQNALIDYTKDYYISFWVQRHALYQTVLSQGPSAGTKALQINMTSNAGQSLGVYMLGGNVSDTIAIPLNTWTKLDAFYDASQNTCTAYVNGKLIGTSASATNTTVPIAKYSFIGHSYGIAANASGRIALLRVSQTLPTAEQIAQIYEDEKVLFQDGAQATLYGASDAVTALAFDSDTELLSVGTSAGRSDFKGLRRVNNTTTAVTTAISASNSMIVEQ